MDSIAKKKKLNCLKACNETIPNVQDTNNVNKVYNREKPIFIQVMLNIL